MLLLVKSSDDLSIDDVEAFLRAGWSEGPLVDYKSEITAGKKLARTIASFANTQGGAIVVGVAEDANKKPVLPVGGIDYSPGLGERIAQICAEYMWPTILPDVKVLKLRDNDQKCVVVIRVFESEAAPHTVNEGRDVPVRFGEITDSEPLAKLDWIEHLLRRREAPERRRMELATTMLRRVRPDPIGFPSGAPWLEFWASPLYPSRPLITESALYKAFGNRTPRRIAGGALWHIGRENDFEAIGAHVDGLVVSATSLDYIENPEDLKMPAKNACIGGIRGPQVLNHLGKGIDRISRLLDAMGWQGSTYVRFELRGVSMLRLIMPNEWPSDSPSTFAPDEVVAFDDVCLASDLKRPERLLRPLIPSVWWSMGREIQPAMLEGLIAEFVQGHGKYD